MGDELTAWQCVTCGSPPAELLSGFSEYRIGTCSNYACASQAPRRATTGKKKSSNVGRNTFIRRKE